MAIDKDNSALDSDQSALSMRSLPALSHHRQRGVTSDPAWEVRSCWASAPLNSRTSPNANADRDADGQQPHYADANRYTDADRHADTDANPYRDADDLITELRGLTPAREPMLFAKKAPCIFQCTALSCQTKSRILAETPGFSSRYEKCSNDSDDGHAIRRTYARLLRACDRLRMGVHSTMTPWELLLGSVMAVGLTVYLVYAMLRPEKF